MSESSNFTGTLIVIQGPTASGKTGVAIQLAKYFNTEIISADSRQFYHEIPIGTAAPTLNELNQVQHHFIGNLSISDNYNASMFENDVLNLLNTNFADSSYAILVGGSGLYIDAVCNGIDLLPDIDPDIRSSITNTFEEEGIESLQKTLAKLDPAFYSTVDINNPKRLMRAIEVCIQTGQKYSDLRKNNNKIRNFNIVKIGLSIPRETLVARINNRVDEMLKNNWIEEAKKVYPYKHNNSLNTVGYKELFAYFDGSLDLVTAIEKIKTNTRRYAKRQMTWFRKDKSIKWIEHNNIQQMIDFIVSKDEIND